MCYCMMIFADDGRTEILMKSLLRVVGTENNLGF